MHKICFDASTRFGWCLLLNDDDKPEDERRSLGQRLSYGTWDLTRDLDNKKCDRRGQYYINFLECFRQLRHQHGIDEDQIEIILEAEAYGAKRSEASAALAGGWMATIELLCERKGWLYPRTVTTQSWRKSFINATKAPEEVGQGLEPKLRDKARRDWLKKTVMDQCSERGLKPKDDNCADAIGMMYWLLRGGKIYQDRQRSDKEAKKKAQRQQTKMNLKVAA